MTTDQILAIDPGTSKTGYTILDQETMVPIRFAKIPNEEMLELLKTLVEDHPLVANVVCEFPVARGQMAGNDLFATIEYAGRYHQICEDLGVPFHKFDRKDVKMTVCGNNRAKDPQVRQALIDLYGGDQMAIGGKKCKPCGGKGVRGREKTVCESCQGLGLQSPRGPLHGFSADVWAALGVGISWITMQKENQSAGKKLESLPR